MPELPDITVYLERLRPRIEGEVLQKVDLVSPFLLRSVDPPLAEFLGQPIRGLRRLGKRPQGESSCALQSLRMKILATLFFKRNTEALAVEFSTFGRVANDWPKPPR